MHKILVNLFKKKWNHLFHSFRGVNFNAFVHFAGEEQSGIGQASNEESKTGHQGVADAKNTQQSEQSEKTEQKDRRKPGTTNEDRTISENRESSQRQLKTVQQMDQQEQMEDDTPSQVDANDPNNEFQHIKDAKENENTTTTMDNATEEQSKKAANDQDKEENEIADVETNDELMDQDVTDEPLETVPELENETLNESNKNNKKGTNNERQNEVCEPQEECSVEGDAIPTYSVPRPDDTTAHCS